MSGRQLGVVELGTDLFGQSVKTGRWPCEFVWGNGTEEVVVLRGEWMKDSAELDLDEDGKLRTIVELPVGNHRFEFVRNEEVIYENEVEVKELDQSINRFSSTVFGGDALKNVADHKGAATGARQLGDGSVEFTYNDVSYAKRVWVVGDFVTEPLELQKEDTGYKVTTVVEPGKHEFRFRVDIGEALTAEAGPQSRLGWHAGTTTGKYLSTNLQEFSVDKSKLTADSTSKPKNQVKKTSLAAVANAAKAVVRTKDVTKNHDSTDRESSPTVEEVKSVLEAADRRAEYNNVDQITPTNVSLDENAVDRVADVEESNNRKGLEIFCAMAIPVVVVLSFLFLRSRGGDAEEEEKKEETAAETPLDPIVRFVEEKIQKVQEAVPIPPPVENEPVSEEKSDPTHNSTINGYVEFRLSSGF